jgi:hypothetical protein
MTYFGNMVLGEGSMAEREGFEPPEGLHPLRFSRPSQ